MWKKVVGFEELYEVNSQGQIRSAKTKKLRKPYVHRNRYHKITLYKNGKAHPKRVHRIVAKAFIPNPKQLEEVNHKDFDGFNNNVNNLEWMSPRDNKDHYWRNYEIHSSSS